MMQKKEELKSLIEEKAVSFSRYTITDRAIPSLTDGLKVSQRRIIYSMFKNGLLHNKYRVKNINAVGGVMAYTPHGDSSVEEALKRLGNDSVVYKLVDGQGAYGTITSNEDNGGSARYLECRLAEISNYLTYGLKQNAVKFTPTYDEKTVEPIVLPAQFPLILANANKGIASGIATNIPSFDLKDIVNNVKNILQNKPTELMYPTFATGGLVLRDEAVAESVKTSGRGSYKLRATYTVDGNDIHVRSLPYGAKVESVINRIIDLVNKKEVGGIVYVNDDCGVDGFDLKITCKKYVDKDDLMKFLYAKTELEKTFPVNLYVLDKDNCPKQYGTDDVLKEWIAFRAKTIQHILQFEIEEIEKELNLLYGMRKAHGIIDEITDLIKKSDDQELLSKIMASFAFNEEQATFIINRPLSQLNRTYMAKMVAKIEGLEEKLDDKTKILNSKKLIAKEIMKGLDEVVDKFYIPRQTEIVDVFESYQGSAAKTVVNDYNVKVYVTNDLYIKKVPLTSLRGNGEHKLKEGDFIAHEVESVNSEETLLFTDQYNAYKVLNTNLTDCKLSDLGVYAQNIVSGDETVKGVVPLGQDVKSILFGFADGKVAKVDVESYRTKTNRTKLTKAVASKDLVFVYPLTEDINLMSITSDGKAVVRNTSFVTSKDSKNTKGVNFHKLKGDNTIVEYRLATEDDMKHFTETLNQGKKMV